MYRAKGFLQPDDKNVCRNHFEDYAVLRFMDKNSEEGICSYCELRYQDGNIIPLESLIEFLNGGIRYFYGDPNDEGVGYDSSEGGWQEAEVYDSHDLFSDDIFLEIDGQELQNDIITAFSDQQWCQLDPYRLPEHQELNFDWNRFSDMVKHKVRYSFFRTTDFDYEPGKELSQILNEIAKGVESLNLIESLSSETIIFRCRQHKKLDNVSTFEQLTSPPDKNANQPNRMSPAGISMFYGALDNITAEEEVIDKSKLTELPLITMGEFIVKETLQIINFSSLPELLSMFDEEKRSLYYLNLFFNHFAYELGEPIIQDGRQHIEYVPTQILTEYFRYVFSELTNMKIDGIKYKSSKVTNGQCLVLFMDNKSSKDFLDLNSTIIKTP